MSGVMPLRRRMVMKSTAATATTINATMTPIRANGMEAVDLLGAFSGHCDEGIVCAGACWN